MTTFALGRVLATPGALRVCRESGLDPLFFISRHARGDWGDLDSEDQDANRVALLQGLRIFSAYTVGSERLYCITEADRASTTLLLASEY